MIDIKDSRDDVFDWSHIEEFTEGDAEMEVLLLKIFIDNLERDLEALEKSFIAGNYEGWDGWAHKLYGACMHMGAVSMAEVCDKAQSMDKPASEQEQALMRQLHQSILQEYAKVRSALLARSSA